MNKPQNCPNCNGTKIEPGSLSSTGKLHFRPEHAKFLKLKTANVDVAANICMDCGHIILMADVGKVKALANET